MTWNGTIECRNVECPPAECKNPVYRDGECCPLCLKRLVDSELRLVLAALDSKVSAHIGTCRPVYLHYHVTWLNH
ncbi:hypothetical protein C0Q70_11789 [Pomacea canaliculata]|uniref:Uncharacterized protein n=1 Tax=Pomacea canaliculata TaxID=400727 RepID=A0A2T7P6Y6_POMCA|nr:hypothetical protein C0Q70_11789 [Pomacea canaliculata]